MDMNAHAGLNRPHTINRHPLIRQSIKQHFRMGILVFTCLKAAKRLLVDLLLPRVVREEVRVHLSSFLLSFAVVPYQHQKQPNYDFEEDGNVDTR